MNTSKNYWLLKSEPSSWSWEQQKKKKTEHWDGVRNYQAANNMKKMKKGDEYFKSARNALHQLKSTSDFFEKALYHYFLA